MREHVQKEQDEEQLRLVESPVSSSLESNSSCADSPEFEQPGIPAPAPEQQSGTDIQFSAPRQATESSDANKFSIKRTFMWSGVGLLLVAFGIGLRNLDPYDVALLRVAIWSLGCTVESVILLRRSRRRHNSWKSSIPPVSIFEMQNFGRAIASSLFFICLLLVFWIVLKILVPPSISAEVLSTARYILFGLFAILLVPIIRGRDRT